MSLEIVKAGLLSTIQDAGRVGYGAQGIHPTGVMDPASFFMANALVGNPDHTAAIELHFPTGAIRFNIDMLIALTGADWQPMLNGEPLRMYAAIRVLAGSVLTCSRPTSGSRCYLAVAGGWAVPLWLGSASTDQSAQAGGWMGRALQSGDLLPCRKQIRFLESGLLFQEAPVHWKPLNQAHSISLLPGPEFDQLSDLQADRLFNQPFTVMAQSDRMGIRLRGSEAVLFQSAEPLISCGVTFGTVQALPTGELIVLMADHPTTGGYPRIAQLPYFEWSRLAQAQSNESLRFSRIDLSDAYALNEQTIRLGRMERDRIRSEVQSYLQQHAIEC